MNLEKEVFEIALADIVPNRFQPREKFEDQDINELALSIKEHGVIQPIIVRKINDKYEIVAGERRFRASQLAGKETIPALIRNIDDKESAKVALLENLQRKNLTAIEEARTYQTILKLDNLTQEELAKNLGKSQSAIANKLRLLNLIPEAQDALLHEKISERHARSLLNLPNKEMQKEFLDKVIMNRMTVKQLDDEIATVTGTTLKEEDSYMINNDNLVNIPSEKPISLDLDNPIYNDPKEEVNKTPIVNNIFDGLRREPKEVVTREEKVQEEPIKEELSLPTLEDTPIEEMPSFRLEETYVPTTEELKYAPIEDVSPIPKYAGPKYDYPEINIEQPSYTSLNVDNNEKIEEINNVIEPVSSFKLEETYVPNSIYQEEQPVTNNINDNNNIYDMRFAINNFRQAIQNTEKFGFNVESEEFDFDNVYQIVIKIDKKKDTMIN